jgi:hypothetical protein
MKTKFLLFLAVLGMGLGFFACEKEGEDSTSLSFESQSQDLKAKQAALFDFYTKADKSSNGTKVMMRLLRVLSFGSW